MQSQSSRGAALTTPVARERAIVAAVRALRRGEIASYGEIARRAGMPGLARLVGHVLRKAGDGRLPWHRVTGAKGRIAFTAGSAEYREQAKRLESEGVRVKSGRARTAHDDHERLDVALWAPRARVQSQR
jgi:methylated-DNA-protein-cysteine methyltransferase related protein